MFLIMFNDIFSDADKMPCSDTMQNQCDPTTTMCNDARGDVECVCRPGFQPLEGEPERCQQIVSKKGMNLVFIFVTVLFIKNT